VTIADQPPPEANDGPAVWDLVIADMRERDHVGRARYGTPLQPFNGRDALVDAYQEALDLCVYLRQAIHERDALRGRAQLMPTLCGRTDTVETYVRCCKLLSGHLGWHVDGVFSWFRRKDGSSWAVITGGKGHE
jgi:hypothetical protein